MSTAVSSTPEIRNRKVNNMKADLSGKSTYRTSAWAKLRSMLRVLIMRAFWISITPLLKSVGQWSQIDVTCSRYDGAGAQLQARYSVKTFATVFGLGYVESPITELTPDNDAMKMARWNQLIEPINEIHGLKIKVSGPIDLCREVLLGRGKPRRVIELEHCHFYTDYFPETLEIHREDFRARASRAVSLWGLGQPENHAPIVIHLRRGYMIYDSDRQRITSNSELFRHLEMLRKLFPDQNIKIYNAVRDDALEGSLPAWVTMDHVADEFEVFAECSKAQVFLMAKSSFSYMAALANPNKVIYQQFWHPPLSGWQRV